MITLGIPQLVGMIALCSAGVGALVLGIMAWRFTGQMDAAYDDGYDDGLRAGARPEPRHAAPSATLPPAQPVTAVIPAQRPPDLSGPLHACDDSVTEWITAMRERADTWLAGLLEDARAPQG